MCGAAEMKGQAFCSGLDQFEGILSTRNTQVLAVTYLIREAILRPNIATNNSERASLNICSLRDLISMYHTHQATRPHDKIYALLGMASDDLSSSELLPDYTVPWDELLQRVVRFFLGKEVRIKTWSDKMEAEISSNGRVLGYVSRTRNLPAGGQELWISSTYAMKHGRYWNELWTIRAMANDVQMYDIVYLLKGTLNPSIIRPHGHYCYIITIAVVPPNARKIEGVPLDLSLVWTWTKFAEDTGRRTPDTTERLVSPWSGAVLFMDLKIDWQAKIEASKATQWLRSEDKQSYFREQDLSELVRRFDQKVSIEVFDVLRNRIKITEDVLLSVVCSGREELINRALDLMGDNSQITESVILAIANSKRIELIHRALDLMDSGVRYTPDVLAIIVQYMDYPLIDQLLRRKGANYQVFEAILKAAFGNRSHAKKAISELSKSTRRICGLFSSIWRSGASITESALVAAAGNANSNGKEINYLLRRGGGGSRITEAILVAAAGNVGYHSRHILQFLLERATDQVRVTEAVLVAAAGNVGYCNNSIVGYLLEEKVGELQTTEAVLVAAAGYSGELGLDRFTSFARLLRKRDRSEALPDSVLLAAASNQRNGSRIMEELLRHIPHRASFPSAVIVAATKNKRCGKEVLRALGSQITEALDVYVSMGGKEEDIYGDRRRRDIEWHPLRG
jgi:hypothetical protein